MRRKALALASAGALLTAMGFVSGGCTKGTEGMEVFEATLSPANEVPARSTAANGRVQYISDGTTVTYTIEVDDINNVVAAHIHSAAAGVNGPIRVFFFGNGSPHPGGPVSFGDKSILVQGSFTAANVSGVSFSELLNQMRNGQAYTNVHTSQFPGGEMRGQIQLVNVK
jgi:CHRD domain